MKIAPNPAQGKIGYITDSDADKKYTYTAFGTMVTIDTDSSPNSVEIDYPTEQRFPAVFVKGSSATIQSGTTGSEGDQKYYDTNPISVGAGVLASEVRDVMAQHVIAVGGPCANAVAG